MASPTAVVQRAVDVLNEAAATLRHRVRRPAPRADVVAGAATGWLAELLAPTVVIGSRDQAARRGVPFVEIDETQPFTQPLLTSPARWKPPAGLPTAWLELATAATAGTDRAASAPTAIDALRDRHLASRAALRNDADRAVDAALQRDHGLPPPRRPTVELLCLTNRPEQLTNVVANVARQTGASLRLSLVINGDYPVEVAEEGLAALDVPATVLDLGRGRNLGECLDRALAAASEPLVIKIDDDDRYGAQFVADLLDAHAYSSTALVGKHSHFAFVESSGSCWWRFPHGRYAWQRYLSGATLLIDRSRLAVRPVGERRLGEDRALIRQAHRRGWPTWSADPFNYTALRGTGHSWAIADDRYLADAQRIGPGWCAEVAEC